MEFFFVNYIRKGTGYPMACLCRYWGGGLEV